MDRAAFAEELRRLIVTDLLQFRAAHADETPYAHGLLCSHNGSGNSFLSSVIATEEGLQLVATRYQARGYRYKSFYEDRPATTDELAAWLRWANPDDGWYYRGLPDSDRVQADLAALIEAGGLGEDGEDLEEFCTDILGSLWDSPEWREMSRGLIVVGLTFGECPLDFLRTATRANPYPVVSRLWGQTMEANGLELRLKAPGK